MADEDGVRDWLDSLKAGFGARFAAAFEEIGVEDVSDLADMDDQLQADLEAELQKAGAKAMQLKKIRAALEAILSASPRQNLSAAAAEESSTELSVLKAIQWRKLSKKKFVCFISHHKVAAAMEARFIKGELERLLSAPCFLDSDDLRDLNQLLDDVKESDVLVLLQTEDIFTRPWCLLEAYTAVKEGVPIVALNCEGKGYDFAASSALLTHLDSRLDQVNPGASALIKHEGGVDLEDMAFYLSAVIPKIISIPFNSSASSNAIKASLLDLLEAMAAATPFDQEGLDMKRWKATRGVAPSAVSQHGDMSNGNKASDSWVDRQTQQGARVPADVPLLPAGYQVRHAILDGIKRLMFSSSDQKADAGVAQVTAPIPPSEPKSSKAASGGGRGGALMRQQSSSDGSEIVSVSVQGLGGSGKTIVAVGLCRDPEVAAHVDQIVYAPFGQSPSIRELHGRMHLQLTGKSIDASLQTDEETLAALAEAAVGKKILLILDDVWNKEQAIACNFLDSRTASRFVITTRIKQLIPGIPEFELGVLSPDDAAALLLEVAGLDSSVGAGDGEKKFDDKVYKVCEICGWLPLVLSIAGSMLGEYGEAIDDDFIAQLSDDENRGCSTRQGDHGDELVDIEDRLITSSLRSYDGADREQVEKLFFFLAILPEDVPFPMAMLKTLSSHFEGPGQKHPGRKIRSWATALLQMSLLKGSIQSGIYMHDIVRHYAREKLGAEELRAANKILVEGALDARLIQGGTFGTLGESKSLSLNWYAQNYLAYHIQESIVNVLEDPEECCKNELLLSLIRDNDPILHSLAALAIGIDRAVGIGEHFGKIGAPIDGFVLLTGASLSRIVIGMTVTRETEIALRAADLLDMALDLPDPIPDYCFDVANETMNRLVMNVALLEDKLAKVQTIMAKLEEKSTKVTFGSLVLSFLNNSMHDFMECCDGMNPKAGFGFMENDPTEKWKILITVQTPANTEQIIEQAEKEGNLELGKNFIRGETAFIWYLCGAVDYLGRYSTWEDLTKKTFLMEMDLLKSMENYSTEASLKAKSIGYGQDFWMIGWGSNEALLYMHGNTKMFAESFEKNIGIMEDIKATKSLTDRDHNRSYQMEAMCLAIHSAYMCFDIGRKDLARKSIEISKITSTSAYLEFWEDMSQWAPMFAGNPDLLRNALDHIIFLVYGAEGLRPEISSVEEILKTPEELMERSAPGFVYIIFCRCNAIELGYRVYEALGNDDMAQQCAEAQLKFNKLCGPRANAHRCLGRIAKRRGEEGAALHFQSAASAAVAAHQPFLGLLAGRELGGEDGDAIIDKMCSLIGKTRETYIEWGVL